MIKRLNPIPQEYQRLVPDFDAESRASLRRIVIVGLLISSILYALFSLADYWFYPKVVQLLLIPRWLTILLWCLTAVFFYWRRELRSIYWVSLTIVIASALLTESLLIISRDPTGPYLVVFPIFMLVSGVYPWPAKWMIYSNLLWLLLFTGAPPLFGVTGDVPRFIFYCAMMTTAAIGSAAVHTLLTRLRWESFLNRRRAEETAAENARLYEQVKRFNEELEQKVRERTQELREAYEKLELLDKNKLDFIKVVSHELRTPMTTFTGYSQMLLGNPTIQGDSMLSQAVNSIRDSSVRLKEIVNTMLDVVKIDSGALEIILEPVSVSAVLGKVHQAFLEPLKDRNLSFKVDGLEALPEIEADPELLYKAFYHLVINAIKYTPDGGSITVVGERSVAGANSSPDEGVKIVVSDAGIGIDPRFHELIFTKFYQTGKVELHSSGKTKFKGGGPGLGLAIVRGIILAHRGRIWVESLGCDESTCPGSRFIVTLPLIQRRASVVGSA
jgi:signal transduction histidine kinase